MPDPLRVCILTTAHAADDVRVYYKIAHSFAAAGMRLSWVGPDLTRFGLIPDESEIPLVRRLYPLRAGRMGRLMRFRHAYGSALGIGGVDVYYCPDPDSAIVAWRLKRKLGGRIILDLHENFAVPHTARKGGLGLLVGLFGKIVQLVVSFICRWCDLVVGVSDFVLSPYRKIAKDSLVIRNCAPMWLFSSPRTEGSNSGKASLTVMHGTGALARGTDIVLEAVALAKQRVDGLRVVIFDAFTEHTDGFGERAFRRRMEQLAVRGEVDFRDPVALRSVPGVLNACEVGMIGYGRSLGEGSLPNRLFEYLASGMAVIAPSYAVEIKEIVEREQCGLLVDFEDAGEVAEALMFLSEHADERRAMGRRARAAFEQRHNWEAEVQPLLDAIQRWSSQNASAA